MQSFKLIIATMLLVFAGAASAGKIIWSEKQSDGSQNLTVYVFWSESCPHCKVAVPFMENLEQQHPWLDVQFKEVSQSDKNMELYRAMAAAIGEDASMVPAFLWCGTMYSGYGDDELTGSWISDEIKACRNNPRAYQAEWGKPPK